MNGPVAGSGELLTPATRISTTAPRHGDGKVTLARISALPLELRLTAVVVAATALEQTTLAAICVTGPVLPVLGRINPRTSTRRRPSSVNTAVPCRTTQGAPPLVTPPMVLPGLDPTTGEKNTNSSARALTANTAVRKQARTAVEITLPFM